MSEIEPKPSDLDFFVGKPDDDGKIAFVLVHRMDIDESAAFLADIVSKYPGASMRPIDDLARSVGLSTDKVAAPADAPVGDDDTQVPNREPVLPYLMKIARESPPGTWTARQLAERCKALGWRSTSARASSSVVRRMDELNSMKDYVAERVGGGRSARWKIAYSAEK